jgi:aspartate carbamoyltransferase catalytic subunit
MDLKGRSLIEPADLNLKEMEELFVLADRIRKNPQGSGEVAKGYLMATLFFEPSTRTRLSFEAAMLRLGGQVIGFSEQGSSSVAKGETLGDTVRTVSCYADIVVMRHPKEGSAKVAWQELQIPLINGGDGGHHHPTQTLTDLYTIHCEVKKKGRLILGVCGDLKFGRTVHSLLKVISLYPQVEIVLISPPELKTPEYITKHILEARGVPYREVESLEENLPQLDILYMTRVQRERFFNEADYLRLKDSYILNREKMSKGKKELVVLHPLPRVNEIAKEVDLDPRALYFKQAKYGMYIRMALIMALLGLERKEEHDDCR